MTRTPTPTKTPSSTPTTSATRVPTWTPTVPPSRTATRTRTPTIPLPFGPLITHFGTATAGGIAEEPIETRPDGTDVYCRLNTSSFLIVVEGRPGASGLALGQVVFNSDENDPGARPDIWIQADKRLGDGSSIICDNGRETPPDVVGGVPAIETPSFEMTQAISDVLNDFGCRFAPHRVSDEACTLSKTGPRFVASNSTLQFCSQPGVGVELAFPADDTLLTVRLRDVGGNVGNERRIIVRAPCRPPADASFANPDGGR